MSTKAPTIKAVFLGDSISGKSTVIRELIHQIEYQQNNSNLNTAQIILNGHSTTLKFIDTTGQERYTELGPVYYKGVDLCVVVYNLCSKESFENAKKWKNDFVMNLGLKKDEFPFLLVGNNPNNEQRTVEESAAIDYADENGMIFCENSNKNDLFDAFKSVAIKSLERNQNKESSTQKVENSVEQSSEKSWGCSIY